MDSDESGDTVTFELNSEQLKGKQSVRATFRLSCQMIDLLKVAATHLGVKQKSLIDELVQNRDTLDQLANKAQEVMQEAADRRQKTFVLSRNALDLLDGISEKHTLSRDYLVELCISRLIPFVNSEQEKNNQRRALINEIEQYSADGRTLLNKADKILGQDDRFRIKLERIINYTEQHVSELRKFVKEKKTLLY